jgi:hypothetical protein
LRINPDRAAIVLVGDADAFGAALEAAALAPLTIERETGVLEDGREDVPEGLKPVDAGPQGPTAGAEEPATEGPEEPAKADLHTEPNQDH